MHILIIPSWYPTKLSPIAGIFFKEQARALHEYGNKITVAFPEILDFKVSDSEDHESGLSFEVEDGINTYRYRGCNYLPRVPYVKKMIFYKRIKKIYKKVVKEQGKPDIIHAHACFLGGWAAAKLSKKENVPFILTEHASLVGKNLLNPYQKKILKNVLQNAKKVIAVGSGLERELARYINNDKITVIPNMISTNDFNVNFDKSNEREKFRFLSVASLSHNKGMDILLKAFTESFKGKNVELIIGGNGGERSNLEQLTKELDIENQVQFLGGLSRAEVKEQMQQCDVFVLASRYETFGVVYIEALACGKPVIATTSGGPETIVNEANGLLVPVDDSLKLSEAMSYMIESYHSYDSSMIRQDCVNRFSEEAVISKLEKVYNDCI
jgi:glycosyltransferase involved in cell wall biosynthesis